MDDPLPPWRTLSSRIALGDPWISVRSESCITAEGVKVDPFYVIETADAAGVVAVTTDRKLVLVRQYRHGYGAVSLEIPAGRIDPGEDPVAAGVRELREETGHIGGRARLLRSFSPNTLRNRNRLHVILVEGCEPGAALDLDPTESIQTVHWPLTEAAALFAHPEFANAVLAGALASGLAELGWGPGAGRR